MRPAADVSATIPDDFDDNNLVNRERSFDTIIPYGYDVRFTILDLNRKSYIVTGNHRFHRLHR